MASHQFSTNSTGFHCVCVMSLRWPPWSTTTLSGHAPSYLADDCCLITDARPRRLRSADTRTLLVSRTRTNLVDKAFSAAGSRVWNYLLMDLRQPDLSYRRFRQSLKTFSFGHWDQNPVCFIVLNRALEILLLNIVSSFITPHGQDT